MKTFSIAASILLLSASSAAFAGAADQTRTIEVRPPNGQPLTITIVTTPTESPYALTGNHPAPADTLTTYQSLGHN